MSKKNLPFNDSFSSAPPLKQYKDGHRILGVAEQEFLKERYIKEFDARNTQGTQGVALDSDLLLADSLKANLRRFESCQNNGVQKDQERSPVNKKDQIDVTAIRRRRKKIEEELDSLRQSINYKNNCLAMSYKSDVSTSLHPAMEQTTKVVK